MRDPQDIDISRDEEMKEKHNSTVNVVLAAALVFIFVLALEHIETGQGFKTLIGSTVIVFAISLAYWAGRSDERKKK